jgi:hypothetical protein
VCGNGFVFCLFNVLKSTIANLKFNWGINLAHWRRHFCNINGRIKEGKDKRSATFLAGSSEVCAIVPKISKSAGSKILHILF